MNFEIPKLPYPKDALVPHLSERTLDFHYEKHHKGYVKKLEKAIGGTPLADRTLEEILTGTDDQKVFNLAAQVWNHTFYWRSLAPDAPSEPQGALADAIERRFGGVERLRDELVEAATGQFGSGWVWLLKDRAGTLHVVGTSNAENPVRSGLKPLLTIDVWEHAYYLDYQNERKRYARAVVEELLDWRFAEKNHDA